LPLYDYKCRVCGHEFEAFQRMDDRALQTCPGCGQSALDRVIGAPAIRTDATFLRGRGTLLQQCDGDEKEVKRIVDGARKQGYTPNMYDTYEPCLADNCGDPRAFLPPSDPRGALKRLKDERRARPVKVRRRPDAAAK